jgi:hypothetical protein
LLVSRHQKWDSWVLFVKRQGLTPLRGLNSLDFGSIMVNVS